MFENEKRPHITVVGDLILDRYLIGDATKLNPEQPGVVIRVDKEEDRLGGAAAVAMIAAGFGAHVTLAGVLGRDEPGRRLQQLIADHDIEPYLWIDDRPTTWKQRVIARGQLRPDRCDREVTTPVSEHVARVLAKVPLGDILLISDYGKGVCSPTMLQALGIWARGARVPILVDPARSRNWVDYGRVSLIKANWEEATEAPACEHLTSVNPRPLALARKLADSYDCDVLITLGRHGMVCAERCGRVYFRPADDVNVRDVCGAGDTILAALGLRLLTNQPLRQVCGFASAAGAQQVTQTGVTAVNVCPKLM